MTWMFPFLARLLGPVRSPSERQTTEYDRPSQINILIPAHNEESSLPGTLKSILAAIPHARLVSGSTEFRIIVGSDGSTDLTADVARSFGPGVEVIEFDQQGKWNTIRALTQKVARDSSPSDWIILADAGILWPEAFLASTLPVLSDPSLMALAPTYRTPDASLAERTVWAIETHFKNFESSLGGPVSIHGATVLYRTVDLARAFESLDGKSWLNDDVVVPLTLRALFPEKRILYSPAVGVYDQIGDSKSGAVAPSDFRRRRRLVLGNLQWIRAVLPGVFRANPVAGLLAMRRVFRVLWAYWLLALAAAALGFLTASLSMTALSVMGALVFGATVALKRPLLRMLPPLWASFMTPYYFLFENDSHRMVWK